MSIIVRKTEKIVKGINYSHMNFATIVSLALSKIDDKYANEAEGNIQVTLSLSQCIDTLGYKKDDLRNAKDSINRLLKRCVKESWVTIKEGKDGVESHILLTGYKTSLKKDEVVLHFNRDLLCHMYIKYKDMDGVIQTNRYICYDLDMFKDCTSLDTYSLYELFKLYEYKEDVYSVSFTELKTYLNIGHKKTKVKGNKGEKNEIMKNESYKAYRTFKKNILSPALKYINEYTDINVTIVKEDKIKDTYTLNKTEKEVLSLDKIYFKIEKKENSAKDIGVISQLLIHYNMSFDEMNIRIDKLRAALEKENINISKKQLATLLLESKDEKLAKCALIDARDTKDVKDIGKFAYWKVKEVIKNDTVGEYMQNMILKYKKSFKDKKSFELPDEMKSNDDLVNVYNVFKLHKESVREADVTVMLECLSKHSCEKIISAINIAFNESSRKGITINSFNYIKTMLERNRFNGKKSDNSIENADESVKDDTQSEEELNNFVDANGKVDFAKLFGR